MADLLYPQRMEQPIVDFQKWLRDYRLPGWCGNPSQTQHVRYFVPRAPLREYLSQERVQDLLEAVLGDHHDYQSSQDKKRARAIHHKCCVVFAILISIDLGHHIMEFYRHHGELGDETLSSFHEQPPKAFPGTGEDYKRFRYQQQSFCPLRIDDDIPNFVDQNLVLPMTEEFIGEGVSAYVFRVVVHDGYNDIKPRWHSGPDAASVENHRANNVFVVKRFTVDKNQDAKRLYEREVTALDKLRKDDGPDPNLIIGYLGAFVITADGHPQSYNILLEYADCGNLNDFLHDTKRLHPKNFVELWDFWQKLFDLLKAVDRIHRLGHEDEPLRFAAYQGVHHDIKPSNILVVSDRSQPESSFPFRFLLADFGLASVTKLNDRGQHTTTSDPRGTSIYGAPETARRPWAHRWHLDVTRLVDIWSIGCIFSEALTWSVLGLVYLDAYQRQRAQQDQNDGPRFHDGQRVLAVVTNQHQECLQSIRQGNILINEIVQLLDRDMLVPSGERASCTMVLHRALRILETHNPRPQDELPEPPPPLNPQDIHGTVPGTVFAVGGPTENVPTSPLALTPLSPRSPQSPPVIDSGVKGADSQVQRPKSTPIQSTRKDEPPSISVEELEKWRYNKKIRHEQDVNNLDTLLAPLIDRDLVFIIDDSVSMHAHWDKVVSLLRTLAYAIKDYDEDGMEVVLMSDGKSFQAKHTTKLVEGVQLRRSAATTRTNPQKRLGDLFQQYATRLKVARGYDGSLSKRLSLKLNSQSPKLPKQCSYFVFTDGVWQPPPHSKVSKPIIQLLHDLKDEDEHRVGISFIQFGNDEVGTKRLRFLDEGLKHSYAVSKDIVDFEPADGNVLKMLLGSIEPWWDEVNDSKAIDEDLWLDG